jgi:hypothetical protein
MVSSPLYFLADAWAPPVKPRWLLQPRPKLAPGDCAIPRFNPRDLFPISPPPRIYKNPSLSRTPPPLKTLVKPPPGCSQPEPTPRSHRRRSTTLPVSLVLLAPSDLHEHISLSSAHLIDLFLILLACQNVEIVHVWILLPPDETPATNYSSTRAPRLRALRH